MPPIECFWPKRAETGPNTETGQGRHRSGLAPFIAVKIAEQHAGYARVADPHPEGAMQMRRALHHYKDWMQAVPCNRRFDSIRHLGKISKALSCHQHHCNARRCFVVIPLP